MANVALDPPNPPGMKAAPRDVPVAAASQPRRTSGWKLAEEEACREDLSRLCPKHTWTNNLAVLECLQDRKEVRSGGDSLLAGLGQPVVLSLFLSPWVCRLFIMPRLDMEAWLDMVPVREQQV